MYEIKILRKVNDFNFFKFSSKPYRFSILFFFSINLYSMSHVLVRPYDLYIYCLLILNFQMQYKNMKLGKILADLTLTGREREDE